MKENAAAMARYNSERYDKTRDPTPDFADNTLVLLKNHPRSSASKKKCAKLSPKFKGPFKIVKKLSPLNYEICDIADDKNRRVAHVEQLEVYNIG